MAGWGDDLKRADRQLVAMDRAISKSLKEAAKAGGAILAEEARRRAPRRTGRLASSITTRYGKTGKWKAERVVAVKAFYASFQEYGTSRMSAQPFMRPAADEKLREIVNAMNDVIAGAVRQGIK